MIEPEEELADTTAAEFALGVLEGDARAAAMRRVLSEPDFASDVELWRSQFGTLFAAWPEANPSEALSMRVFAIPGSNDPHGRFWRIWAGTATAIAASLLLLLVVRPAEISPIQPRPEARALVAALVPNTAGGVPFVARYDGSRSSIRLSAAIPTAPGRSIELWAIGSDQIPRSLGIFGTSTLVALEVPPEKRSWIAAGTVLALSIEPIGGSRSGKPTGPVIASGAVTEV